MHRILIVEDDRDIAQLMEAALTQAGYQVELAFDGEAGADLIEQNRYALALLDIMLPKIDGYELFAYLREYGIPAIFITAKGEIADKTRGFHMGADDYLTKPFGTVELLARIRTALRHTRTDGTSDALAMTGEYRVGDLCVDYNKHRVFLAGEDTHLTPNEYKIVALLGRHAGQVLTYKSMMKELWGPGVGGDNKLLRVHMANIRRKIEPNPVEPQYIFTEVGVGYRMADSH